MAKKERRFERVYNQDEFMSSVQILADKQTGVQYLFYQSGGEGGMTVLVDRDGKPLLYHQETKAPEF